MKKKLLAIGLGAALSMTAVSTMASTLTLKSQNILSPIGVSCNGIQGLPIPPNSQLGPLPYAYITSPALFNSHTLRCTFTVSGNTVGTAKLIVGPSNTHARVVRYSPSTGYSVTITNTNRNGQPVGIYAPAYDMVVTLSQ